MSTVADIVTAVGDFVDTYALYITAGLVLGAGAWLAKKLIKAGR